MIDAKLDKDTIKDLLLDKLGCNVWYGVGGKQKHQDILMLHKEFFNQKEPIQRGPNVKEEMIIALKDVAQKDLSASSEYHPMLKLKCASIITDKVPLGSVSIPQSLFTECQTNETYKQWFSLMEDSADNDFEGKLGQDGKKLPKV